MSEYEDFAFLEDLMNSPQYAEGVGMPGDSFSKRASALKSLVSLSGLPLPQLMAGGWTEQTQAAPINETAAIYGSNPMYKEAFAAIDQGADPQTVFANLSQNGAEYGFDPFDETQSNRVFSTLEDYAKGRLATQSVPADPGRQFTLANGKTYRGDPDVMGFASEYDLLGAPSVQDLMNKYAASRGQKQGMAKNVDNAFRGATNLVRKGFGLAPVQAYNEAVDPSQLLTPSQRFQFNKIVGKRLEKSKTNMVRSDANANAMRNLMAIRAMLGM